MSTIHPSSSLFSSLRSTLMLSSRPSSSCFPTKILKALIFCPIVTIVQLTVTHVPLMTYTNHKFAPYIKVALLPGKKAGTHCTGGCLGHRDCESHGTFRTVHTTYAAALKTTTHPKTRCRKPYIATQHLMLLMMDMCTRNMSS